MIDPHLTGLVSITRRREENGSSRTDVEVTPSINGAIKGGIAGAIVGGPVGGVIGGALGAIFGPADR